MKQFILGLAIGVAITASYFILTDGTKPPQAALDSQNEPVADSKRSQVERAGQESHSETSSSHYNQDSFTKHAELDADSRSKLSGNLTSDQEDPKYSDSQYYLDEYDRELRERIDTISERLSLSEPQRLELEKKLLEQKNDLVGKVGEEYLDHIMIDEFSIGLEEDLTGSQIEEFSSYKHEKAMYAATISSEALVAAITESTGISNERAKELKHALIETHYNNRTSGEFTNPFSVIENSLTPEEWNAYRTKE